MVMKRNFSLYSLLIAAIFSFSCTEKKTTTAKVYSPVLETNQPFNAKIYTLDNGLTVCLSVNKKEPRAHTLIGIKTGSKNDPAEVTGLAHYLEHMLFKGTSKMGTSDWEKEKALIAQISDVYEKRRFTTDSLERITLYKAIDSLSFLASEYAVANEYDKLVAELGAQGTNAYTSLDQTVYTTDVPVSELEKWMKIESERFSELVLRLFHTEIEAVYEEFNIGQDSDDEKAFNSVLEALYRNHSYGTQTTIGEGAHLQNPSLKEIHKYFDKYYVPNNMIISISGDINIDSTIAMVDAYFGDYKASDVPEYTFKAEDSKRKSDTIEVFGKEAEYTYLAYRLDGADSQDRLYMELIDGILNNGSAGLIDLNLITQQKVLDAWSYPMVNKDYSTLLMAAYPKRKQSVEECSKLLSRQIEKIKAGDFPDWLPQAVVNNLKLEAIESLDDNRSRADKMLYAYLNETGWKKESTIYDEMAKISKADIVAFAKEKLNNNHVVVYKKDGEPEPFKVQAPEISPIKLRKNVSSDFYAEINAMDSKEDKPQFLDYKKEIQTASLDHGMQLNYIQNTENELFSLNYIFDFGKWSHKELALAIEYLPFLGTTEYSASELKEVFFKKGLRFNTSARDNRINISIKGLNASLKDGIELMEHIIHNVEAKKSTYKDLVAQKLKKRSDAKLDNNHLLWNGLYNYAIYGKDHPENYVLHKNELKAIKPAKLTDHIHNLFEYKHDVFYYGPSSKDELSKLVTENHKVSGKWTAKPEEYAFKSVKPEADVLFLHHEMVQAEIIFLANKGQFDPNNMAFSRLFNNYLGTLTFREVRESKALAYSCYTSYASASRKESPDLIMAYVGAQADKFGPAAEAILSMVKKNPANSSLFNESKESVLKKIASNRTVGENIFWSYLRNKDKGMEIDINKSIYQSVAQMDEAQFEKSFKELVAPEDYTMLVIGDKNNINKDILKQYGKVKYLNVSDILNY